ncbi:MAG: DUF5674 family protein [Defluviitaleaceae bacterium]|nr:DUF5674 family protein [Defluviitaleaceae bacterium]
MILHKPIEKKDFYDCTHKDFGVFMVKLVADLQREILAYDAEWHADLEAELAMKNKSTDILDSAICADVERVFRIREIFCAHFYDGNSEYIESALNHIMGFAFKERHKS